MSSVVPLESTTGSFREETLPPREGRSARPPIATAAAERVVLVDEHDEPLGTAEKLAAHLEGGRLHRVFSIFLFDGSGRVDR